MELSDLDMELKLAGIFRPYAAKRRESFVATNGRFVHYTSADNAIKIIQTKRFWMRNAKCMNDYMEISHGHELLVKFFNDQERRKLFFEVLEPFEDDVAQNVLNLFDQWWNRIQFNTFICCISEHDPSENAHGRLSMWRAYGQTSAKAAVVLNVPFEPDNATKDLSLFMTPAAYFSYEDVERELLEVIANIKEATQFLLSVGSKIITDNIFGMLVMAAVSFKHEGFKEEREWRVIYLPDLHRSNLMSRSLETIDGVPQSIYKIPLEDNPNEDVIGISIPELIESVIVGPSEYALPLHEAFTIALKEAGIENAGSRVIISGIPLRT